MKKITTLILALFVAGIIIPIAPKYTAQAQTISASAQAQLDLIKSLTQQLQTLQAQIDALRSQQAQIQTQKQTTIAQLVTSLKQGSSGDNVKVLQALLAADPTIYPEGMITGYYGALTSKAVRKFQEKHGIEQAGIVGPKTLKKLNEFLRENPIAFVADVSSTATSTIGGRGHDNEDNENEHGLCAIVPPGHLIAKGWLKKHDGEREVVPSCQTLPPGIDKKEHGDDNENENEDDNHNGTSTQDTTAPIISSISATNITTTGATISWVTNENADSDVYYSTTSPVNKTTATKLHDGALGLTHTFNLTGLAVSTTYHYIVESKDASGNESSGAEQSFVTVSPDVTPPVISVVTSASVASTTATITWTTNENSTSKVYYSTATPLNFGTALTATVSGLATSHSVGLTGLNATTTYYYAVESADASSNTATSSQSSFTTTL